MDFAMQTLDGKPLRLGGQWSAIGGMLGRLVERSWEPSTT
jgi:hypothetical protein